MHELNKINSNRHVKLGGAGESHEASTVHQDPEGNEAMRRLGGMVFSKEDHTDYLSNT